MPRSNGTAKRDVRAGSQSWLSPKPVGARQWVLTLEKSAHAKNFPKHWPFEASGIEQVQVNCDRSLANVCAFTGTDRGGRLALALARR